MRPKRTHLNQITDAPARDWSIRVGMGLLTSQIFDRFVLHMPCGCRFAAITKKLRLFHEHGRQLGP